MIPGLNASLVIGVLGGVALGGGVTWLGMRVQQSLVVAGAVKGERARQVGICAQQLKDQAITFEANTAAGISEAGAASDAVPPTPTVTIDLVALCNASPECRSRGKLP